MKKSLVLIVLTVTSLLTFAQPPRPAPTPNDTLKPVSVSADNALTFRVYAPNASSVTISGDFKNGYPAVAMNRESNGVWSYTTAPMQPDLYSYDLTIDGVHTLDPKNMHYKEAESHLSNLFLMPGKQSEYCATLDVPHGNIQQVWFYSKITEKHTRFHVYTPPVFEKIKKPLPVLYLQHGGGDNDASWTTIGRANFILDNLYAAGKILPMVVVMPMGHPTSGFFMNPGIDEDPYYKQLFEEIMPLVSQKFHVSADRYKTAYAGLSMGGLQALNIAIFAPEKFGYVMPLSTGYFPAQRQMLEEKYSAQLRNPEINKLKLFWISMGGETDIAYANGKAVNDILTRYGIRYQTHSYPAGHTFLTWRHDLETFAPMLFR